MKWSNVKLQFESLFAKPLQGRLKIHLTAYTNTNLFDVGRGWLTLDGDELVSVQIPSVYSTNFDFRPGTLSFGEAVCAYLSLSLEEAKSASDELLCAFVFLDRRYGKRSLRNVKPSNLHSLSRLLFETRCRAEGIPISSD